MANALYDHGRKGFLAGEIDWDADTIKIALLKSTHTPDLANDDFWDDVSADLVDTAETLASKTTTGGVADAADVTFTSVTGSECGYLCIYKDTGTPSTSPLIALLDSAGVTGLPVTPNGGDIEVQFDSGADKIFKL
jgi:hypothetical protein